MVLRWLLWELKIRELAKTIPRQIHTLSCKQNVRQFILAQLHSSIICFLHEIVENYRYSLFVAKIKLYLIFGMRQLSSWNKKILVNPNPDLLLCLRVMKRINGFLFLRNDKTFLFSTKRFWLNRKSGIRTCHIEMVFIV